MSYHPTIAAVGIALFLASPALAERAGIYVEYWDTIQSKWLPVGNHPSWEDAEDGWPSESNIPPDAQHPFDTQPGASYRIYTTSPSTMDIGTITIDGDQPNLPRTVFVGQASSPVFSPSSLVPVGANDIGAIIQQANAQVQVSITGNATGQITGYAIGATRIDGQLQATLKHNPGDDINAGDMGVLRLGSVGSSARIESFLGDVPEVNVKGNIAGSIVLHNGNLGNVDVTFDGASGYINLIDVSGDIGTPGSHATITAANGIDLIDCDAIYADITANDGSGTGGVRRIITRVGPFEGSLTAQYVGTPATPDWLNVHTDLSAVVTASQALVQRAFIGRSFLEGAEINLPANGLQNVITINTQGHEDAVWEGFVKVGTHYLTAPNYTSPNSSLGDGGVAMVEFDDPDLFRTGAQGSDCIPEHNSFVVLAGSDPEDGLMQATMRFYGYVDIVGSTPLTITMSPYNNQWISDVTDEYQVEPGDPVADGFVRELVISRIDGDPFPYGYKFTFTPTTDLQSDGLGLTVYDIAPDGYWFWISTPFDLNRNLAVDAPDINVWLSDPSDLNGDSFTDQQDLEDLVEAVVNGG